MRRDKTELNSVPAGFHAVRVAHLKVGTAAHLEIGANNHVGFILHDTLHSCFAYYFADPRGEHFQPAGGAFGCLEDTIRRKPE